MTNTNARASKLHRSLAIAQASITMLGLVAMSMPATALAFVHPSHPTGTVIVKKIIVGDDSAVPQDFAFTIDKSGVGGTTHQSFEADGQNNFTLDTGITLLPRIPTKTTRRRIAARKQVMRMTVTISRSGKAKRSPVPSQIPKKRYRILQKQSLFRS